MAEALLEVAMHLHIAAVDLVSNTCFPALAADELGYFKSEGLDAKIELLAMLGATKALRQGGADAVIAGSVFDLLTEFPDWQGAKIAVALSRGTPWLLVVRSDLRCRRGDLNALRGLRLAAAQGPDLVLKQLLNCGGLRVGGDLELVELAGARSRDVSFGVFAARALQAGQIDGFWANAMGAETAVASGAGKILVDVRRGDDPAEIRYCTFAGMATTDAFLQREPKAVEAAVRAIVKAQNALRADPFLAREVGRRKFPADAAALIARVVARDAEFYDPAITEEMISKMNRFARSAGQLSRQVPYDAIVAARLRELWKGRQ